MTTHQISWVIAIMGFIAIGTAFTIWDRMTPVRPPKTPEQQKLDEYYRCVRNVYLNNRSIDNCNLIK